MSSHHNLAARPGFTGWHMLAIMVTFFGVVISVNMFMAYNAVKSWSGLVVPNTYVASQQFNGKAAAARARAATGITGSLTVDENRISYTLIERDGKMAAADTMVLNFRRPVGDHQDFSMALERRPSGIFEAMHELLPGHWIVEAIATRNGEIILHEAKRISVKGDPK